MPERSPQYHPDSEAIQDKFGGIPHGASEVRSTSERRERLTPEELGNLLAALGNNERKAALLVAMLPGELYTKIGLWQRMTDITGIVPKVRNSEEQYCERSLAPIGLLPKMCLLRKMEQPSLHI